MVEAERLKLQGLDEEDLAVLSAHVQDAVLKVGDLLYLPQEQRFAVGMNRFIWEKADGRRRTYERRRTALTFDRVKAVQVSLDGASRETYNRMRVRGDFDRAVEGIRTLGAAGVPIEINYSPTRFNVHEIGAAVDLAHELGAYSFYTGRTMFTGNAVKTWHALAPSDEQYRTFFEVLHAKAEEYRDRMRVYFHEAGLLEELRYRLQHPAALLIVLPNGLVKLINALPFVCGDLRRESLDQVWANFQRAWQDPRVTQFVEALATDPRKTAGLHQWVYL